MKICQTFFLNFDFRLRFLFYTNLQKNNMCCDKYVFKDWWDSVIYNFSEFKFNKRSLLPYGIFKILIIVSAKF